jgi:hypothetical protein
MSDTTDVVRAHPATLAEDFFKRFRDDFAGAAMETVISKQGFHVLPKDFDEFLVDHGVLEVVPDEYNSNSIPRRGAVMKRNEMRNRVNAAALKAEHHPAFHIGPARPVKLDNGSVAARMRIKLINHYAADKPIEIAHSLGLSARHCQRMMKRVTKLADRSAAVSAAVRDYLSVSTMAEPMLEAVEKVAQRLERELRRSELIKR